MRCSQQTTRIEQISVLFIRVSLAKDLAYKNDTADNIIQLNHKTVYGSEVAFCMWRIVWCSGLVFSIAIATMAYIVVEGDFCTEIPDYVTCIKRWQFGHDSNYYA